MRGKVDPKKINDYVIRITPAYAGKSSKKCYISIYTEDHPRLCGEKFSGIWENIKSVGAPPPMRGKAYFTSLFTIGMRITPAYAGKS